MLTVLLASVPVAIAGLLCAGLLFQKYGLRQDARRFPAPGRFVATSAGVFHVHESAGRGTVSIVLESGLAGSSLSWAPVRNELSGFAPVFSYDRIGFGWSSPIRSPRTLDAVVEELRTVLEQAGVSQPYLLVGHSLGGLLVRAFAHAYPDLTAGLVLVDPVSPRYWAGCTERERARLRRGIRLARRGAVLAQFGLIRLLLSLLIGGRRFLPQAVARLSAPGASSFLQKLTGEVRKLPSWLWPIVRAQWSRPIGFRGISAYLASLEENCSLAMRRSLVTTTPTTILSAATATEEELQEREAWLGSSRVGIHRRIPECGHWIQVERPAAVIEAVGEIIRTLQAGSEAKCETNSPPNTVI